MTRFERWIKSCGGHEKVARILDVSTNAVYKWTERRATPRVVMMQKIVLITKGHLTLVDLVRDTQPK